MKKTPIYFLYVFIALSLVQCTKDRVSSSSMIVQQDCTIDNPKLLEPYMKTNLDTFQNPYSPLENYTYIQDTPTTNTINIAGGIFNPNNSNQILYLWWNANSGLNGNISFFDLCTGQSKLIANNVFTGAFWNIKDWITFEGTDYNIWKIKSNGDSLTRLTYGGGSQHEGGAWNPDGTKFIYYEDVSASHIIADANGNLISRIPNSTIPYYCGGLWMNKDTILFSGESTLYVYDIRDSTVKFSVRIDVYNGGAKLGPCYAGLRDIIDNENLLMSDNASIYKYNLGNGQKTIIRQGADNREYGGVFLNAAKSKIAFNQADYRQPSPDTIVVSFGLLGGSRIFIANIDGSNQQWVKIPQN